MDIGTRVQVNPALDIWMSGDRFGKVVDMGRVRATVLMDASGKKLRFLRTDLTPVEMPESDQPQPEPTEPQDYLSGGAQGLLAAIVSQNARDAAWTANTLIDSYQEEAAKAQATLAAIRACITEMANGDYMPTGAAFVRALYPSADVIDAFRQADR